MILSITDLTDFIIMSLCGKAERISMMKMHKLLYYVQAWHLAFFGEVLFRDEFQAWIHGPVSVNLMHRFSAVNQLYSFIGMEDVMAEFTPDILTKAAKLHIQNILDSYGSLSGMQMSDMSKAEEPWIEARGSCRPAERCEVIINEITMQRFYSSRLEKEAA